MHETEHEEPAGGQEAAVPGHEQANAAPPDEAKPSLLREIIQPFIDLVRAPRALWGINLAYLLEGMAYFGVLVYLTMHFSSLVFKGVQHSDELSHDMVGVLTAGITISMFLFGWIADKKGVRFALVTAFIFLVLGRTLISGAPNVLGLQPNGLWSPLHLVTMGGMLLVVAGYGMYQPAAYAAVRLFTTPKTAGMGFAMLYALMNLGGWLPTFAFLLRDEKFLGLGIPGVFWVYTGFTVIALLWTYFVLSQRTVEDATAKAKEETARIKALEGEPSKAEETKADTAAQTDATRVPWHMHVSLLVFVVVAGLRFPGTLTYAILGVICVAWVICAAIGRSARWLARHPLADVKFFFFIFALIPVQTLFTYNWLVLPQYVARAFQTSWVGKYFEIASNLNALLIFFAVPIVTALTQKAKVYNMMILGTLVMASPAFLLAIGPYPTTLFAYILIMTIGEAMWQPRFLQYAAEIAPEGRTGAYMGVAQLPWFLTKVLVPWLYSGWMMERFCPATGAQNTQPMWLIYGCIAIASPILLVLAKRWVGKDFKTTAAS